MARGGLDKASALADAASAAQAALIQRTKALDPAFPYKIRAFDESFFKLPQILTPKPP